MTATAQKLKLTVNVEFDRDTENPTDWGVFDLVTFGLGHTSDVSRYKTRGKAEPELDPKNKGITWWPLSCYRHGNIHFSLRGHESYIDHWDTTLRAGILYLKNNDPTEVGPTPTQAAKGFIDCYNEWANGNCFWYSVEYEYFESLEGVCPCCKTPSTTWNEKQLKDYDSCGGYIGVSSVVDEFASIFSILKSEIDFQEYDLLVKGDAANLFEDELRRLYLSACFKTSN